VVGQRRIQKINWLGSLAEQRTNNDQRPTRLFRSPATIGRIAQTDECNSDRHEPQFDCSYRRDKTEFILKLSALGYQLSVKTGFRIPVWTES